MQHPGLEPCCIYNKPVMGNRWEDIHCRGRRILRGESERDKRAFIGEFDYEPEDPDHTSSPEL